MNPETAHIRREAVARLLAAVEQLDPRDRRIVEGLADGLSFSELSPLLGVSKQRSHQLAARTCRRLREALAQHNINIEDFSAELGPLDVALLAGDAGSDSAVDGEVLPNTICPRCSAPFKLPRHGTRFKRWCDACRTLRCNGCNHTVCVCAGHPSRPCACGARMWPKATTCRTCWLSGKGATRGAAAAGYHRRQLKWRCNAALLQGRV